MQNNFSMQRKQNGRKNIVFTVAASIVVGIVAAGVLLLMTLTSNSSQTVIAEEDGNLLSSSLVVTSEVTATDGEEAGFTVPAIDSETVNTQETQGEAAEETADEIVEETPSATAPLVLEGDRQAIVQADDRLLVVVNGETELPSSFTTNLMAWESCEIDKAMAKDLQKMYDDAANEDVWLWLTYGYRSNDAQKQIYNANVAALKEEGMSDAEAKAEADKTVQRAGQNEYATGLSVGFNTANSAFGNTAEYQWLLDNAADYGFILRYPEDKEDITGVTFQPWRFRYVGKTHAKAMGELGYCLEEYVTYLNHQE